ncbi:hypothetical protein COL63_22260 [Bacillus pseudomycoides]|uniref:hypothetical protein n=1 Tax=Bacillus pseudomycoides TaxID=64104 RepID=UPI000BF922E8|nr:hypothetical protein [Bacillus pseudomycoides]PFZ09481.1 hypothetical protein COL63_22260 [Bacillus pseudomycoides]
MKKLLVIVLAFICTVGWAGPVDIKADLKASDADKINRILNDISAYASVDEHSFVNINEKEALKNGISQKYIDISKRYFDEQNRLVKALQNGENLEDIKIDRVKLEEFEEYFMKIAEGNKKVQKNSNFMKAIGGCSGDKDKPHPCPPREVKLEGVSLETAQRWLIDSGFHRTSSYAGGGKDPSPALDFTKCVSDNSCVKCSFRDQAVIADQGDGKYKVTIQASEPNPEVLEYMWPSLTWGFYVKWWHDNYC